MIVHSFVSIQTLIDNTPGIISPIGELSPNSATFSRELGHYSSSVQSSVKLTNFASLEGDVAVQVPLALRNLLLEIAQWTVTTSADGNYSEDRSDFKQIFTSQYPSLQLQEVGPMEKVENRWYPTYFVMDDGNDLLSLWFSDQEFDKEYPLYEIFPIMPVDDLDALHGHRADAFSLIDSISITNIFDRIDSVRAEYPFTHQFPLEVNWVDKNDPNVTKPITFTTLIYGNAGKNIDLIKNSLVEHILANSTYSREEWEKVLPELFLPNEFYITPMWDDVAVESLQSRGGLYSSSSNFEQLMSYGMSTFAGLTERFIRKNIEHVVSIYKSVGFAVVGNDKNQTGIYAFKDLWPEFSTVSTLDANFDYMSKETKEFSLELIEALGYAERWDGESYVNLPNSYSTIERDGKTFIVFSYNRVNYLVSVFSNQITPWFDNGGSTPTPNPEPTPSPSIPSLTISASIGDGTSFINTGIDVMLYLADDAGEPSEPFLFNGTVFWSGAFKGADPEGPLSEAVGGVDEPGEGTIGHEGKLFLDYSLSNHDFKAVITGKLVHSDPTIPDSWVNVEVVNGAGFDDSDEGWVE